MEEIRYGWERLYRDAILELDPTRLARRIDQAEAAILLRLEELGIRDTAEELAIKSCLFALRAIRRTSRATIDSERIHR